MAVAPVRLGAPVPAAYQDVESLVHVTLSLEVKKKNKNKKTKLHIYLSQTSLNFPAGHFRAQHLLHIQHMVRFQAES